ncbi:MAG: TIGR04149 family rSAM-modified RiPP [Flavobacterium sp.]
MKKLSLKNVEKELSKKEMKSILGGTDYREQPSRPYTESTYVRH